MSWSHQMSLSPMPTSAARARNFVSTHLIRHGLTHLLPDVRLVAGELATNAFGLAPVALTVTLSGDDTRVLLTVHDDNALEPSAAGSDVMATRGRGLDIVASVSHDWGVSCTVHGTRSVWASFGTEHEPRASPTDTRTRALWG